MTFLDSQSKYTLQGVRAAVERRAREYGHNPGPWVDSYPVPDLHYLACKVCGAEAMINRNLSVKDDVRYTGSLIGASCTV